MDIKFYISSIKNEKCVPIRNQIGHKIVEGIVEGLR